MNKNIGYWLHISFIFIVFTIAFAAGIVSFFKGHCIYGIVLCLPLPVFTCVIKLIAGGRKDLKDKLFFLLDD